MLLTIFHGHITCNLNWKLWAIFKKFINESSDWVLFILKTDLSTSEAETTLRYLDDVLASLRTEALLQTISEKTFAAVSQKAVKIIAYRNGAGYQNGQLITASTFPMVRKKIIMELIRTSCSYKWQKATSTWTLKPTFPCSVTLGVVCIANTHYLFFSFCVAGSGKKIVRKTQ